MLEKIGNSNFYWKKIGLILLIEILVVLVLLLRGGKGINSIIGADKCSLLDWLVFLGYIIATCLFLILSLFIVISESKARKLCGWEYHKDDVRLDKKLYVGGTLVSFMVGIISVVIGIGGSTITTPFLLSIGVIPQVISYTSMYLTTLSAIINSTIYIVLGKMPLDFLAVIGFLVVLAVILAEW